MDEFLGVAVEDYAALIQDEELGAVVDSAVRDWFYLARLLVEAVCGQKKGVLQAMGDQQGWSVRYVALLDDQVNDRS